MFNERDRHYVFVLRWLGFNASELEYEHGARYEGKSSYTLKLLMDHALSGILFQTTAFLKLIIWIGLIFGLFGILFSLYFFYRYFFHTALPGWTSLFTVILTSTGIILLSLGVIGFYIGKIFSQTKDRPLYIIDVIKRVSND